MKKIALLALPILAAVALAGMVSAYPDWSMGDMTQEEKALRVQMLEQKQEAIQNRISYLNSEITGEDFQERMEQHRQEMSGLREQFSEQFGPETPGPSAMNTHRSRQTVRAEMSGQVKMNRLSCGAQQTAQ
jgi:hypothetical protein